ncbi:MAG: FHIPEP family type III secretion protein [Vulcanimicrobiota bacterium]
MARNKPEEMQESLQVLRIGDLYEPFAPWKRNEKGRQIYIKLTRGDEDVCYLFVGTHYGLKAEVQQGLMRLVNEGWNVEGELQLSFDGRAEPGTDPYVYQDPLALELGRSLLPVADPQHGCPLMGKLESVREDVARELGIVTPPIRVLDNLQLDPNQYVVRIKDAAAAAGEVFLDRLMALGGHEQLDRLEGWATTDPVHRMRAKWIEPELRDQAEQSGCLVLGPLAVLMTHLKAIVATACPELLGLQETHELITRLAPTHPVVVEDFLVDRRNLRLIRQVLRNLLSERVPVRDLVTILETAGDMLDRLERVDLVTEFCRGALSRQICNTYLNQDGVLRGLALGPNTEKLLTDSIQSTDRGPVLSLTKDTAEDLVVAVRKQLEEHGSPPVLFTDPPTRLFVRKILARSVPGLGVLATTEIASGIKVEVAGQVELEGASPDRSSSEPEKPEGQKKEGVFGFLNR